MLFEVVASLLLLKQPVTIDCSYVANIIYNVVSDLYEIWRDIWPILVIALLQLLAGHSSTLWALNYVLRPV